MVIMTGTPGRSAHAEHKKAVDRFLAMRFPGDRPRRAPRQPRSTPPPRRPQSPRGGITVPGALIRSLGLFLLWAGLMLILGMTAVALATVAPQLGSAFGGLIGILAWLITIVCFIGGVVVWVKALVGLSQQASAAKQAPQPRMPAPAPSPLPRVPTAAPTLSAAPGVGDEKFRHQQSLVRMNYQRVLNDPESLPFLKGKDSPIDLSWHLGAKGEELTARRLHGLSNEYYVWHDVAVPGSRANLDHVVIGPCGIVNVDSKAHSGSARLDWDKPYKEWLAGRRDSEELCVQYELAHGGLFPVLWSSGSRPKKLESTFNQFEAALKAMSLKGAVMPRERVVLFSVSRGQVRAEGRELLKPAAGPFPAQRVQLCDNDLATRIAALPRVFDQDQINRTLKAAFRTLEAN